MGKRGLKNLCHREPWDNYDWRSAKKKARYEECNPEIIQHGQWQFLCKVEDGDGSSVCLDDIYIRFLVFLVGDGKYTRWAVHRYICDVEGSERFSATVVSCEFDSLDRSTPRGQSLMQAWNLVKHNGMLLQSFQTLSLKAGCSLSAVLDRFKLLSFF